MELKDRHAFFFLDTVKGKPKVNFMAYAKMPTQYALLLDTGGGFVPTSQMKKTLAEIHKKHTLYDYEDYTADEMYALFKSKVSTFFNRKWFHNRYNLIVTQLLITATPKAFDGLFYLDALDNKPKVGVMMYKRNKSGYVVNFYESGKLIEMTVKEAQIKTSLASLMRRVVCYRYSEYTPAKLEALFNSQDVPAKYDVPWFEEQYDKIKKFKGP